MIHLAHARIEAGDHPSARAVFPRFFAQGEQRAHADHAYAARERESLRHARGDAKAGKRARARAVGDALDLRELDARLGEHFIDHAEDRLRLALAGTLVTRVERLAAACRYRAEIGGRIDREQVHIAREFYRIAESPAALDAARFSPDDCAGK